MDLLVSSFTAMREKFCTFNVPFFSDPTLIRTFLAIGTVAQDAVHSTLVSGYCLQAHLLTLLANALRQRALQHSLSTLDWMRVNIRTRMNK
jgi:hypothetical protein